MKKKFGDLTVRELWAICDAHPQCKGCPLDDKGSHISMCAGGAWPRLRWVLDKKVDL